MSSLEDGEIEDDVPATETLMTKPTNSYSMLGHRGTADSSSAQNYRSAGGLVHSSESGSDGEEDTPMWRQKQEKYFRKNKHSNHCPSPTLQEFKPGSKNGRSSADANKKRNNVWGSVLEEQDLTHALVFDGSVNKSKDINYHERNVESYDFTNKYKDKRPDNDAEEPDDQSVETQDPFQKMLKSTTHTVGVREVIGYEDTLYGGDKKNRSRKRKAESDRPQGKSGIHNRLGAKKVTTVKVGEWVVNEDMEIKELAKKIAEYIHETKVELIERVAENLGKAVAIRILNQTRDVEDGGGMLTLDGSRRRTPGGVYLQLLKQQPEYNKDMYKLIFVEDNEFKIQENQRRKQRKRSKQKARRRDAGNTSHSRSRSASAERCPRDQDAEKMEEDGAHKSSKTESPGEKMDCVVDKSEKEHTYRKSRSHSHSVESGELKSSENFEGESSKVKSRRSRSFSAYSDDEDDDGEESGEFDFQKQLEIAKTLITKKKSEETRKGSAEMEEAIDKMSDELDEAGANVVDIPLDD